MIKNYFKIAWRNLWNHKLYSLINILGLAIGISCCLLIYLYVNYELSYDSYNDKADRIFRMTSVVQSQTKEDRFAPTSPIMGQKLKDNFPEIEQMARLNPSSRPISYQDKKFFDTKLFYADSTLFDVFTFPVVEGNLKTALSKPYSVVLSESTAKKYFGKESAYGKMMQLSDTIHLMVTAVIKDIPANSHFNLDGFLSRNTMNDMNKENPNWKGDNEENWFNCNTYTYILLKENSDPVKLQPTFNSFMTKEQAEIKKAVGMCANIDLQPIKDIHLHSRLEADYKGVKHGDITYVYIFIGSAVLIMLIACSNFINLSTARSLNRAREIGLRKVIGAKRIQLILQFLGESVFVANISGLLALILVLPGLSLFNALLGTTLTMNSAMIWLYLSIIIITGVLAGIYPALLMSSFAPIRSLKGRISHNLADILFRKGLVIFQFSVAITLIIGTSIVLNQLDFIQNHHIGMNKEQVLSIELKPLEFSKREVLLREINRNPRVVESSLNGFSFKGISNITLLPEGTSEKEMKACPVFAADENFFKTFQVEFVAGRDFAKDHPTDLNEAFIINETAVKEFGWKTSQQAIGKHIIWAFGKEGKVIGVVKDFNFSSLKENIQPLLVHIYPQWFNVLTLRLKTDDLSTTLRELETTWKEISPQTPFSYSFAEDDFNSLYLSEMNMRTVLTAFTVLSVFVACLGLFGLAAFTIRQRYREIGIRKVLGASVNGIVRLLSKDFLKLVAISVCLAVPVAWYFANKWLQNFAYKTTIHWWLFLIAGLIALLIAFATVSIQAMRAAVANPVKSIRTE